jgi:hypothetical protein
LAEGGGCLFWLVVIWLVLLFYFMAATLVAALLAGALTIGVVLSAVGWVDEGRLSLMDRPRRYALPGRGPLRSAQSEPPVRRAPPPVARPPLPPRRSPAGELKKLADLHESGVLTDKEYQTGKAKLLSGTPLDCMLLDGIGRCGKLRIGPGVSGQAQCGKNARLVWEQVERAYRGHRLR